MPGNEGPTRRIVTLLDELLSDRQSDASGTLRRISQLLTPRNYFLCQAKLARRIATLEAMTTDAAVRAACVMSMTGVPPYRLLHFLSASLPGTLSLPQFELAVSFIFDNSPPLSEQLYYDLTQYTYLEEKLLSRRSVEVASRLKETLSPRLLLFLYILSLREDLSNENVRLILLILRLCFPELRVRGRAGRISRQEEREAAEAWKNAQKSARYESILSPVPGRRVREADTARDSASYFLDKYFADSKQSSTEERPQDRVDRGSKRSSFVPRAARDGVAPASAAADVERQRKRAAGTGDTRSVSAQPPRSAEGAAISKRRAAAGQAARSGRHAPRRVATAKPPVQPPVPRGPDLWIVPGFAPLLLAAAALAAALFVFRPWAAGQPYATPLTVKPPPPPAVMSVSPPVPGQPTPTSYMVQSGDSLWKIYRSLRSDRKTPNEWKDFLRMMKEKNDLSDPDRIYPGAVLSIETGQR